MAGKHIALCHILRLKGALQLIIALQEFQDLRIFKEEVSVLQSDDFWNYLFTMCCSLYAPMRVLHLADQKIPVMDKLHYYVCRTDTNLSKYIKKATSDATYCKDTRILSLISVVLEEVVDKDDSDEDIDDGEEDDSSDNKDSVAEASLSDNDDNADADPDDPVSSKDKDEDTEFINNAIGAGTGQLRQVFECNGSHFLLFLNPSCQMCSILIHVIILDLLIFLCNSQIAQCHMKS
jgi:hypothetical protein